MSTCWVLSHSSRVWVVSGAVLSKDWQLHTKLVTDFLSGAVTWRCASTTVNLEEHSWYFDRSGERPFYLKRANFCHSGIPRNETFSVWSWDFLLLHVPRFWVIPVGVSEAWFSVVLGGCWDTQVQIGTWLAPGWQSAVLALQSSVLHSGNLLQWTWWGQGHRWASSPGDTPLSFRGCTKQERH